MKKGGRGEKGGRGRRGGWVGRRRGIVLGTGDGTCALEGQGPRLVRSACAEDTRRKRAAGGGGARGCAARRGRGAKGRRAEERGEGVSKERRFGSVAGGQKGGS